MTMTIKVIAPVVIQLSDQWYLNNGFVDMKPLAEPALKVVKDHEVSSFLNASQKHM